MKSSSYKMCLCSMPSICQVLEMYFLNYHAITLKLRFSEAT